jgi:hypothetical protein
MVKDFLDRLLARLDPTEAQEARELADFITANRADLEREPDMGALRRRFAALAQAKQLPGILAIVDSEAELQGLSSQPAIGAPADNRAPTPAPGGPGAAMDRQMPGWLAILISLASGAALLLLVAALMFMIAYVLWSDTRLMQLADISVARGLITYLFTIGTIGIAVLMIASLFVSNLQGLKERFDYGKEILTALIAILGTIVGFYFGSERSSGSAGALAVEPPTLSSASPAAGTAIQLATLVTGGAPPYRYTMDFRRADAAAPDPGMDVTERQTQSGLIVETVTLPAGLPAGTELLFDLTVTDAGGRSRTMADNPLRIAE